jgi:hypothetical protein
MLCERSSEVRVKTRDYGRRGLAALTMRQLSIRKRWRKLRRQAAVALSV